MIPRISRNAVKEGFDTLPAAICYFDRNGLLRLINHRMQEIAAVLCGRDLQTLTDLEQALRSPGGGVRLRDEATRIFIFRISSSRTMSGILAYKRFARRFASARRSFSCCSAACNAASWLTSVAITSVYGVPYLS